MNIDQCQGVSAPVIRNGYDFRFRFNDLTLRAGGSAVTGREYVYVNDELISSSKNRLKLSVHDFNVEGNQYRIEFEMLNKVEASLACRLYCNNELVKLFAAAPQRLWLTRPLFFVSVILALLINDSIITGVPLSLVLAFMAVLLVTEVVYPMRHIKIMELEV